MPGGIGPVGPSVLAAGGQRRGSAVSGSANEIFFNLDGRRVYYDARGGWLYFVDTPDDLVGRTLRAALAGLSETPVFEQLHLDVHRFFAAARRVRLAGGQANAALAALRLAGVRAVIG
jgi:hypothetical protein